MTLTVSDVTRRIKSLIEGDQQLSDVILEGEISNFKYHRATGHLYFSLKDEGAVINAVMFRSSAQSLGFQPADGMKVLAKGRISLYEKSGQYQIYVTRMKPAGLGDLHVAFEKMKRRLYEEGLFAPEHKKPLPKYPRSIGVITSKSGAAVQDILNILGRRYPIGQVLLYPALVQGEGAVDSMVRALDYFDREKNVDVILLGRGGGSIEDLWAFNEEKLARRVYNMTIPVISAVGHETDTTICDYVADLRAPTPSAAAELAVPDLQKLYQSLTLLTGKLQNALLNKTAHRRQRLSRVLSHRAFRAPDTVFATKRMTLDRAASAVVSAGQRAVDRQKLRIAVLAERIDGRSPLKIMTAGYSILQDETGKRITSTRALSVGQTVTVTVTDGRAQCTVDTVTISEKEGNG